MTVSKLNGIRKQAWSTLLDLESVLGTFSKHTEHKHRYRQGE